MGSDFAPVCVKMYCYRLDVVRENTTNGNIGEVEEPSLCVGDVKDMTLGGWNRLTNDHQTQS